MPTDEVGYTSPRSRTLPNLMQKSSAKTKPNGTEDISPLQTRAQRAKKTKQFEDAFDSSDDEEESDK